MQHEQPNVEWLVCAFEKRDTGSHFEELCSLSEFDYSEVRRLITKLHSSETSIPFLALVDAWHAFTGAMDSLGKLARLPTMDVEVKLSRSHILRRVTSGLLNYLAAARMYEDATRASLSAKAGGVPDHLELFNSDVSRAFDTSRGYRFTYHLRNAFQHEAGLPLSLRFDADSEKAELQVNRDELLRVRRWHTAVRRDIESQSAEFAVRPLMAEAYSEYLTIEHSRAERDFSACADEARALSTYLESWGVARDTSPTIVALVHESSTVTSMRPFECPSIEWLHGFTRAAGGGQVLAYLMPTRQDPETVYSSTPREREVAGVALDLLDVWHGLGPDGAARKVKEIIALGPQASADVILGLLNIAAAGIIQEEMLLGGSFGQHLHNLREIYEGR